MSSLHAPTYVHVIRSVSPGLDAEAVRVVTEHARFETPAPTWDDLPAEHRTTLPVEFRLR